MQDPNYPGAVSVAGAGKANELPDHFSDTPGTGFYLTFIAYGIHARFPSFAITCKAGSSQLSFRSYPRLDHTPSMVQTRSRPTCLDRRSVQWGAGARQLHEPSTEMRARLPREGGLFLGRDRIEQRAQAHGRIARNADHPEHDSR
jgi:hypothetical protein